MVNEGINKALKERSVVFELLRIILIILVLNLHLLSKVTIVPDSIPRPELIAVPLFIVLSFYLNSNFFLGALPASFSALLKRIKRLLIPLIFWSAISFVSHPSALSIKNLIFQTITGSLYSSPLYFLKILLNFTVIFYLLSFLPLRLRVLNLYFFLVLAFFLQYSHVNFYFFTLKTNPFLEYFSGRFVELFPYAVLGLFFGLYQRNVENLRVSIALLIAGMIGCFISLQIASPNGFRYQGIQYFFVTLTVFTFVNYLHKAIRGVNLNVKLKAGILILGRYSFGVFLLHIPILEVLLYFSPFVKNLFHRLPYLSAVLLLVICYIVCIGADKASKERFSYLFR